MGSPLQSAHKTGTFCPFNWCNPNYLIYMLPRALTSRIEHALGLFPVAVVTGSRQTGKSTLAREAASFRQRRYVTLDTTVNREVAVAEPMTFLGNQQG
jgi:hypothetical protein